jgi:uncharacterized protein
MKALAFFFLLGHAVSARAATIPQLTSPVVDQADLISGAVEQRLAAALTELSNLGSGQVAVLTVPDLEGEPIEQYAIRVVEQWKLGTESQDNGVLLLVSRNDRQMRIEVGQGFEGDLPDAHAKRIIEQTIAPMFREGDTDSGILLGVREILNRVAPNFDFDSRFSMRKSADEAHNSRRVKSKGIPWLWILILLFFFLGRGRRRRRSGLLPFLGGMAVGHSWGRGGGFGGGGFSSGGGFRGGGGGFSGGGASGGW